MKHFMNLNPAPFLSIKSGEKDVEMRLYDDKRRAINKGDKIEFTNNQTGEKLVCSVLAVRVFKSFDSLYRAYDKTRLGYKPNESACPCDMKQYYPLEQMQKDGVCAIEIKLD